MHTPISILHCLLNLLPDNPLPFPLLGVIALVFTYALLSNLVVDLICPAETVYIDPPTSSSPSLDEEASRGMSVEQLLETPCFNYGECYNGATTSTSGCAICFDGFVGGERCRVFPVCNHVFHSACIDLWLVKSLTCPTCRSPFRSDCIV